MIQNSDAKWTYQGLGGRRCLPRPSARRGDVGGEVGASGASWSGRNPSPESLLRTVATNVDGAVALGHTEKSKHVRTTRGSDECSRMEERGREGRWAHRNYRWTASATARCGLRIRQLGGAIEARVLGSRCGGGGGAVGERGGTIMALGVGRAGFFPACSSDVRAGGAGGSWGRGS